MRLLLGLLIGLVLGIGGTAVWYETRSDQAFEDQLDKLCSSSEDDLSERDLDFVKDLGCNPALTD